MDHDELLALALSRPADALTIAREVLANAPSDADAAVAHQAAGIVHRDFGDIGEAVAELKAAYRHARRAADPDREAEILASLGVALVMAGHTDRGLAALDSIVPGRTGVLAGRILIRRAWVRAQLGRYAEALADAEQAVALLSDTGDLVWEARALTHRAMVLLAMGAIDRADQDYARSEELFAKCGQQIEYADTRQARGRAAFARGDLPAALLYFDDAQRVVEGLGVLEPDLFVNKCMVLLAAGLTRDALTEINSALDRIEQQRGSTTRRAELLYCAGMAAHAAGALDLAESRSRDALKLFRRQQRPWWAARAELALLQSRYAGGARTAALVRSRPAGQRRTRRARPGPRGRGPPADRPARPRAYRPGRGQRHLRIAAGARNRGLRARGAGWLAQAMLCEGDGRSRAMLAACRQGLSLIEVYLRTLGATELRVLATAQGAELAAIALRYAVRRGDARQVLEWSERWRATVLAIPPVRPQADDDLVADLAALRNLTRRLEASDDHRPGSGPLHRERRRLESAVRRRVSADARHHRRPARAVPQRRPARPPRRPEPGRAHRRRRPAVRRRGGARPGPPRSRSARPAGDSSSVPRVVRTAARGDRTRQLRLDLDAIGARLEAALLGEAVKHLGTARWSSYRLAGCTPFRGACCRRCGTGRRRWPRPPRHGCAHASAVPPSAERVVLIGGPQLSTGPEEVRRLAELYPDAVVLTAGDATAEAVLEAMDGASLVHVAAHGTFRADSPLFSALRLDDGPLTVYDLERLERAPHRVVLSSCSSALGGPSGADELLGLVSALVALGSSGVVASVVPVNDPATVPLMLGLHGRLQAGDELADALAQARASAGDGHLARTAGQSFIALGA